MLFRVREAAKTALSYIAVGVVLAGVAVWYWNPESPK
jgi:hypothetical protein